MYNFLPKLFDRRIILTLFHLAFAVLDPNEQTKAEKLTEVLTLLYSFPAVQGVNLWGFWDQLIYDESAALYTGSDVTVCVSAISTLFY